MNEKNEICKNFIIMKKIQLAIFTLLLLSIKIIFSQNYELVNKNGEFQIINNEPGEKKTIPKEIGKSLKGYTTASVSGNGNYIAFFKNNKLYLADQKNNTINELMALYKDNEAVSQLKWWGGNKKLAFVNINTKRYPNKTKLFLLTIENGQLKKKEKFNVAVEYKMTGDGLANANFVFHGESIQYELGKEDHYQGIVLYERYIHFGKPAKGKNYEIVKYATALPAEEIYVIIDNKGNQLQLPEEIQKALFSPTLYDITPDNKYLIYSCYNKNIEIKSYNFESGNTEYLMSLYKDNDGTSGIIWNETGDKMAFVNVNQEEYPQMCKIFVLEIKDGSVIDKQKFDAPVFFHCGASCYPEMQHFKFINNKTIQYKRHEMIDERPGEIETITIN